ncbi:hypothetical protein [Spongiactinospora sp. TRM90649]|uniref:hypothetical protein n=1 Tax=Spongiactinospora sp. TRM90649 TaxID=3031114 RepID=UPI0023F99B56|nr:hypothetical protein [Spongiactinospora sp. TRM90649]MDF5757822.1 hypothetical protein [Spongiactinospora sp. TRM90649]
MTRTWAAISPVIPTVAVLLLAALWGASVYAGWGLEAFCSDGEPVSACAARLETVSTFSGLFAVVGGCCAVAAWLLRSPHALMPLMIAAVVAWVAAEGVLFLGGMLIR